MNLDAISKKTELAEIIDSQDPALKNAALLRLAELIAKNFDMPNRKADSREVQICTKLTFGVDRGTRLVLLNCDGRTRWIQLFMMHRFSKQMLEWISRKQIALGHDELPYFHFPPKPDASITMGLSSDRFAFTWKCIEDHESLFEDYLDRGIDVL
jgi:hypothetical protein